MALPHAFLRRWVRTVWSAALAWAVLPTLMAMAGLAPVPSVAMALGEVCSVNAPVAPANDLPVGATHGASCLLCVLGVPMAAPPLVTDSLLRPADPGVTRCASAVRTIHAAPHARRACPQGPPSHACAVPA
jgi:hypothetical protein